MIPDCRRGTLPPCLLDPIDKNATIFLQGVPLIIRFFLQNEILYKILSGLNLGLLEAKEKVLPMSHLVAINSSAQRLVFLF